MQASRICEILIRALYNGRLMGDPIAAGQIEFGLNFKSSTVIKYSGRRCLSLSARAA
jgi:hypothetical protein